MSLLPHRFPCHFSQVPLPPKLPANIPEFSVDGSFFQLNCSNPNANDGPFNGTTIWVDSMGNTVGTGGMLVFDRVSRNQAGLYTCVVDITSSIPGDPAVVLPGTATTGRAPNTTFSLVIHCKLNGGCRKECFTSTHLLAWILHFEGNCVEVVVLAYSMIRFFLLIMARVSG